MKILTKKVIRTISKILDELWEPKTEVSLRIGSYEAIIDSDGKIIESNCYEAPIE